MLGFKEYICSLDEAKKATQNVSFPSLRDYPAFNFGESEEFEVWWSSSGQYLGLGANYYLSHIQKYYFDKIKAKYAKTGELTDRQIRDLIKGVWEKFDVFTNARLIFLLKKKNLPLGDKVSFSARILNQVNKSQFLSDPVHGLLSFPHVSGKKVEDVAFNDILDAIKQLIKDLLKLKGTEAEEYQPAKAKKSADKIGTCSICLGEYAIDPKGKLVSHGFRLLKDTVGRTNICPGHGFDNLEVSSEGVVNYLKLLKNSLQHTNEKLEKLIKAKSFTYDVDKESKIIKKGTDDYEKYYPKYKAEIEKNIKEHEKEIDTMEKRKVMWDKKRKEAK